MTNGRVEVITSVERRRRWSAAEKQQPPSASLEPGACVLAVVREAGIHPGQLLSDSEIEMIELVIAEFSNSLNHARRVGDRCAPEG